MFSSQPLNSELFKDSDLDNIKVSEQKIKKQYMGRMFEEDSELKTNIFKEIYWFFRYRFKDRMYDIKWSFRNWFKWVKTITHLRPWDGQHGVLLLAKHHLEDYLETEVKYGNSEESYKQGKINSVKECLEIIERFQNDDYVHLLLEEVKSRYPIYLSMITNYDNSTSYSGDFIQQTSISEGDRWVGIEDGNNPREGCFELVNGKYELAESIDPDETTRLLNQVKQYRADISQALDQARKNQEADIERIGIILKNNFFQWWD